MLSFDASARVHDGRDLRNFVRKLVYPDSSAGLGLRFWWTVCYIFTEGYSLFRAIFVFL